MRTLSVFLVIAISQCAIAANPEESAKKRYLTHTYGPTAIGRAVASGGLAQVDNTPKEWGQGMVGFGRRFASAFGFHIVKKSIEYPVAYLHKEQYGYHPSDKTGTKGRLIYALTAVVITHKRTDGSRTINAGELSGAFGAGLISRLWQPASTASLGSGFASAGTTIAIDAAYNVVREFWPEIRHPHSHAAVRAAALLKMKAKNPDTPVPATNPDDVDQYLIPEQDREDDE
jgi:hypothetical protein